MYGGNGTTTFGLPDLRGRAVVGVGQGPGLSTYSLGQVGGVENTTLNITQLPAHIHPVSIQLQAQASDTGSSSTPGNGVYAAPSDGATIYAAAPSVNFPPLSGALTVTSTGGNQPFSNLHPVFGLNYIICLRGVYPARN